MQKKKTPSASLHFWVNEELYIVVALKSSWISGGACVERLEEGVARYCDTPRAITASNGTSALHMAYLAMDIRRGRRGYRSGVRIHGGGEHRVTHWSETSIF